MSIVSTSNLWLNRLYKTVAILLVLLAVLISAFRLFLPYVHHYRIPLQDYLNEKSQANIVIGSLSMTWQRFGPNLVIGDVQVLETESASIFIEQLDLEIDFWRTVTEQNLISKNLILSGARVNVSDSLWLPTNEEDTSDAQANELEDEALTAAEKANEADDIGVISDLFLNRIKRFSIRDSQITVKNKFITRSARLNQLNWLNTDGRHQAQGSVVLNGLSSNNLQLKLDLLGERGSDLSGRVHLQANHIDITPWLDNVLVIDDDKTKTDINFSALLRVRNSEIKRLQVDVSDSHMDWLVENKDQRLTLEQGQLLLVKGKKERSFKLYSTPLALKLNGLPTQHFTTMLNKQADDFSLHLSEIDVAMLARLTPLIVADKSARDILSKMTLSGKIEDLYINRENGSLKVVSDFSHFNNSFSHGIPGLKNVSGQLSYIDNYLAVDFSAKQGTLDFDKLFVQAFPYQDLSGKLNVTFGDKGWALTVEELDFLSKEINLSAQVKVEAPIDEELTLALLANVSNGNAGLVGRYLPLPIMSTNLVNYLNAAVVSGRVEDAQVLINGPISHFPFVDGSGIFVVDAELSKAEFKFVDNWPSITDFVANLNFTNNSMLITGRDGSLTGLNVTGVEAAIADLAHGQILTVDADINEEETSDIKALMDQSPFKDSVGSTLEVLQVAGKVSGEFNLHLPLNNNEQALASGTIIFDNNNVALQTPNMNFTNVQGQLNFSNDKISTKDLSLVWQGLPIALNVSGINKADYYDTDIHLNAKWQERDWLAYVPERLKRYTQGELPWQGHLSLHQHHQGGFSYTGDFSSQLENTKLVLPTPFNHDQTQKNHLSVQLDGQIAQTKLALNYGDKMHFSGYLDHENTAFTRANLMLGQGTMALPTNGFHITTKLEQADFSKWQPLISDILDAVNDPSRNEDANSQVITEPSMPFIARPKRIRGSIGQLAILGQQLNNVSFNLLDKPDWWLLQLNAKETRSQIKIHPDWLKQGLEINAEFLNLSINETDTDQAESEVYIVDKTENDIIFANIPPLKFHCDVCTLDQLSLGEVDATISRNGKELIEFSDFKASRGKTSMTLSGHWRHNEAESKTSLVGDISVDDIETELKAISFDSIIKDSGAELTLDLNWQGGFHDFDLSHLNGDVTAKLDDGYLADVSDKGARMFSVLSLQSLVRKLTLDFRDIFSDGMFYSKITGDYQLNQGTLTTHNTEMDGTAGNLFMTGHTDLISGELAYDMSYKPNLTSSLPVLAWIVTLNPVTFLAGVAIDQVIKSQVVSEFNFELTGTVDNPEIKEVNRKSKSISVDASVPKEDIKKEEGS